MGCYRKGVSRSWGALEVLGVGRCSVWWLLSGLHPGRPGHGCRVTRCSELVSNPWLLLGKGRQEQNTWAGQLSVRMWAGGEAPLELNCA